MCGVAMSEFCPVCENMLYMSVVDVASSSERELRYRCKKCGHSAPATAEQKRAAIFETSYDDDQATFQQYMTPMIREDPTLPHRDDIVCVKGDACTRKPDEARDVMYIKYDHVNLKFLYHCVHCGAFWKSRKI